MIDKIIEQQETIKGLQNNQDSLIKIMKEYEDYKLRVEKAIEHLEEVKELNDKHILARDNIIIHLDIDHIEYLLKILKGDSK